MMISQEGDENNQIDNNQDVNKGTLHYSKMEMIKDLKNKFPQLNNLSTDEAEERLIYGMNLQLFTEKAKIKDGVAFTTDEDSLTILIHKSKKTLKIYLLKITDISIGKLAGNFKKVEKMNTILQKIDDTYCLTIHYDYNFKYYNFIFKNSKDLEFFILGIIIFLEKTIIDEIKIKNTDLLSLKKIWKEYDPNQNKYLNLEQFSKFLASINFQWKKKKFDQIFREIDSKKEGKIRFKDFISFYELIVTGEEFREVFQKYSSDPNKKYISMRGLSDFLEKEQHIKLSSQEILNLMTQFSKKTKKLTEQMKNKDIDENNNNDDIEQQDLKESLLHVYENHSFGKNYYTDLKDYEEFNLNQNFKNVFNLNFREFVNMLIDKNTNGIYNQEYFSIYLNMNLPLYNYYIYSSHNTYLEGNQLNSKCTVEMYYIALKNGCRLLELDCWDGRNGVPEEPIITHWHFPVGEVNFKEVLLVIKEFAFKKSEFPVVLSIENHCSPKAQMNMEKYFREVLGSENMFTLNPEDPPLNYPSPNDLKRKFVIKAKRKRIFGNFETLKKNSNVEEKLSPKSDKFDLNLKFYNSKESASNYFYEDDKKSTPQIIKNISQISQNNLPKENLPIVENANNRKNNKKQLLQTNEIIHEEDVNSKNEENLSDLDENVTLNDIYAKEIKENILFTKNDENINSNQNLNNSVNPKINSNASFNIDINNASNTPLNVNLNVKTYNITNNYYIPDKGNLKNLTKTGNFNRSVSSNENSNVPVTEFNDTIGFKEEIKTNEDNTIQNIQINTSNKKSQLKRQKSLKSSDSVDNSEKGEAQAIKQTNSNKLFKKLKMKYSIEDMNIQSNKKEEEIVFMRENSTDKNSKNIKVNAEIIRIQEIQFSDKLKLNKPKIKTIDQFATVVGMLGVKYKKEDFDNSLYLPWECISISEPDFEKYIQDVELKIKIIKFCQRGFLKIYPDVMRTNSSNHNPIKCWSSGVQIAALNIQKTDEDWVLINKIFFKLNGGSKSGYILKPEILLNPNCDEAIKKMFWKPIFKIKFKILSGFHLHLCFPKGIKVSSIFVEVTLKSPRNPEDDKNIQQVVLTTETISNNFLHPVWQSNSKQFEIYDPDLSFFLVKIYSAKRQHVLARSVIPVKILNLGYRVLHLYDDVCSKFDSSFLMVKTNKIFLN